MLDTNSKLLFISIVLFISMCALFFFVKNDPAYFFIYEIGIVSAFINMVLLYNCECEYKNNISPPFRELIAKSALPILGIILFFLFSSSFHYLLYQCSVCTKHVVIAPMSAFFGTGSSLMWSWKNWSERR